MSRIEALAWGERIQQVMEFKNSIQYRRLKIDAIDVNQQTIFASLSSEAPVQRFFGTEILTHLPDAINLERAANGLPLLFNHNDNQPIGVVESIWLDTLVSKLRGNLKFSPHNQKSREVWPDVRDGYLKNLSIGYRIEDYQEIKNSDTIRITKWTPLEVFVVSVPADFTVGINKNMETQNSTTDN